MRRHLYFVLVAVALSVLVGGALPAQAASYGGHWKATLSVVCKDAKANANVCGYVLGTFAALGKAGTTLTEISTDTLTVAANNTFTDVETGTITMSALGVKIHGCPPLAKFGSALFNGTCLARGTGKGHIAIKGGEPVFYYDSLTLSLQGKVLGTLKGARANTGLPTPAKVGTYGAAWAARHANASSAPPGFSFQGVVSRSK
jgi:hypothetical protein